MCAFGGSDLKTLYVTSLTENMSADELAQEPLAGALFAVSMPVAGTPVAEFGI
ncbi:gluconolactonase domain protein [Collimonas arenae]|nr:gluconolactonase domain protein [Collimonas arenae]